MSTELLDQIITAKKKQLEEKRKCLINEVNKALSSAQKVYPFTAAYIFGSLSSPGRFTELSDVDIAVEGVDPGHFFKLKAFIEEKLGMEVDVIDLKDVHFQEKIKTEGIKWTKGN